MIGDLVVLVLDALVTIVSGLVQALRIGFPKEESVISEMLLARDLVYWSFEYCLDDERMAWSS